MSDSVQVSREITATPERVWGLVSDLPRMGEWSNENQGGVWSGDPTGPIVGARFRGANRNGVRRWRTLVTVTHSEPGERFGFEVSYFGLPISSWTYDIVASGDGCTVTETWTDRRPGLFKPIAHLATGVADRQEHTRAGIALTLERLAATAEAEPG